MNPIPFSFKELQKCLEDIEICLKTLEHENMHSIRLRLVKVNLELILLAKDKEEELFPIILGPFMDLLDIIIRIGKINETDSIQEENSFMEIIMSFKDIAIT